MTEPTSYGDLVGIDPGFVDGLIDAVDLAVAIAEDGLIP